MPRNLSSSAFMKPFVILALPGMYLFYKYNQYKQQQQEQSKRKVTEKELAHLNHKIDKLLAKLEENEPEMATSQDDECVICVNAKATMQTSPCGHRVVCRKCFVKTIQMAVSQRLLPLRCVICRAKILRLKQSSVHGGLNYSKSWLVPSSASSYSMSAKSWSSGSCTKHYWTDKNWVPSSASQYSMTARNVPNSASMYSMASGSSSLSGMSSISSATNSSTSSRSSSTALGGRGLPLRQPIGSLRKSQQYSMKMKIQEYNEPRSNDDTEKPSRLAPITEFQKEYRLSKAKSSSTRIRCAQKIVTQLEAGPLGSEKNWKKITSSSSTTFNSASFFKSKSSGKDDKKRDKEKDEKRREKGKQQENKAKAHDSNSSPFEITKKISLLSEKKKNKKEDLKEDGSAKGDANKTEKKKPDRDSKLEKTEMKCKNSKELEEAKDCKKVNENQKETFGQAKKISERI